MIVIEYDKVKDKFYFTMGKKLDTIYGEYSAIEYLQTLINSSYELSRLYIHEVMNDGQKILA